MYEWNQLLEGLVRRRSCDYKVDLIETEQTPDSPREMKVPQMDGIEGSAKDPQLHWMQIAFSSPDGIA